MPFLLALQRPPPQMLDACVGRSERVIVMTMAGNQ